MAKMTRTRLVVSTVALMLIATMTMPTTTDARGGGGFRGGGFSHGGRFHVGLAGTVRTTGPSVPGPATSRRGFASLPRSAAAASMSFSHRHASSGRASRIGSHFFTLGADGAWVDNFVYAPTVLVAQQPLLAQQQSIRRRTSVVRTPSAARAGIILVRGDSKSFVTFAGPRRG